MLGVVNKAIENFVITVHGGALWQQVLRSIGEPGLQFEPMLITKTRKPMTSSPRLRRPWASPR